MRKTALTTVGYLNMVFIRPQQDSDSAAVRQLLTSCFPTSAEADLVDALRIADRLPVSLVAVESSEVIGHIAFSPVTVESGGTGLGLAPLAVLPHYRRRGIGAELVDCGLEACRELGCPWVVVLGEPEYYARFGFLAAGQFGLLDEYGGGNAFQVLKLQPGELDKQSGFVRYAPEFAALA